MWAQAAAARKIPGPGSADARQLPGRDGQRKKKKRARERRFEETETRPVDKEETRGLSEAKKKKEKNRAGGGGDGGNGHLIYGWKRGGRLQRKKREKEKAYLGGGGARRNQDSWPARGGALRSMTKFLLERNKKRSAKKRLQGGYDRMQKRSRVCKQQPRGNGQNSKACSITARVLQDQKLRTRRSSEQAR